MNPDLAFSPAPLSYVAALRGVRPHRIGETFTYAETVFGEPNRLVCLAASNPEGRFYGLALRAEDRIEGEKLALARQVGNVTFIEGAPGKLLALAEKNELPIPSLQYFCCDERRIPLSGADRAALFKLAERLLIPGGLFGYGYRAYDSEDGALRFLVRELAPEMNASQAKTFLDELKKLGAFYFSKHPEAAAKLQQAVASGVPDQFFSDYDGRGKASSGSFDTIVALRPRGFAYAGDADISKNYVDLAAPASAHSIIFESRNNHLYEPIKDFTLNRQERCDVWCRVPAPRTSSPAELFGNFVYGITIPRAEVPQQVKTEGNTVDLGSALFAKLVELMTFMPLSIGDFLAHADGKAYTPADVVGAIQILVACGLARPMRGHYRSLTTADLSQPRLVGTFNQYLDKTQITGSEVWLASPVTGSAVAVSARDALVMQALNRAGLANSVSALLPELQRLAKDPASIARIPGAAAPTSESATKMIKDTVTQSAVQWYAYGLLAAA